MVPRCRQDRPKRVQEPPRAAQDPLKTAQELPQEPSWDGLGPNLGPSDHKIENQSLQVNGRQGLGVDFGSPNGTQNDPKTTPRRVKNLVEKCIVCFIALGPVLDRS